MSTRGSLILDKKEGSYKERLSPPHGFLFFVTVCKGMKLHQIT
jgi:hypothetical protein